MSARRTLDLLPLRRHCPACTAPRGPFEGKRLPRASLLVAGLAPEDGALMHANRPLQRQRAGHPGTGAGARPNGTLSPPGRIWTVSLRRSVDSCSRLSPFRTTSLSWLRALASKSAPRSLGRSTSPTAPLALARRTSCPSQRARRPARSESAACRVAAATARGGPTNSRTRRPNRRRHHRRSYRQRGESRPPQWSSSATFVICASIMASSGVVAGSM